MGNALEQLRKETRDDARLYGCIRELYEQGVPFEELKAVIPDIRRTREQLHMKRMLENNNEVLMQMFSRGNVFSVGCKGTAGGRTVQKNRPAHQTTAILSESCS